MIKKLLFINFLNIHVCFWRGLKNNVTDFSKKFGINEEIHDKNAKGLSSNESDFINMFKIDFSDNGLFVESWNHPLSSYIYLLTSKESNFTVYSFDLIKHSLKNIFNFHTNDSVRIIHAFNRMIFYSSKKMFAYTCQDECLHIKVLRPKSLTHFEAIEISPLKPDYLLYIDNNNKVYYSKNFGKDWKLFTDSFYGSVTWSLYREDIILIDFYFNYQKTLFTYDLSINKLEMLMHGIHSYVEFTNGIFIATHSKDTYTFFLKKYNEPTRRIYYPSNYVVKDFKIASMGKERLIFQLGNGTHNYLLVDDSNLKLTKIALLNFTSNSDCNAFSIASNIDGLVIANINSSTYISFDNGFFWHEIELQSFSDKKINKAPKRLMFDCSTYSVENIFNDDKSKYVEWLHASVAIVNNEKYLIVSVDGGFHWKTMMAGEFLYSKYSDNSGIWALHSISNQISFITGNKLTTHKKFFSEINLLNVLKLYAFKYLETNYALTILHDMINNQHELLLFNIQQPYKLCSKDQLEKVIPAYKLYSKHNCYRGNLVQILRPTNYCSSDTKTNRSTSLLNCPCEKEDFGCSFGYEANNGSCIVDRDEIKSTVNRCSTNGLVLQTSGNFVVDENECIINDQHDYAEISLKCIVSDVYNFIVWYNYRSIDLAIINYEGSTIKNIEMHEILKVDNNNTILKMINKLFLIPKIHCFYWIYNHSIYKKCPYSLGETIKVFEDEHLESIDFDPRTGNIIAIIDKNLSFISPKWFIKTIYLNRTIMLFRFKVGLNFLWAYTGQHFIKISLKNFKIITYIPATSVIDFDFNGDTIFFIKEHNVVKVSTKNYQVLRYVPSAHSITYDKNDILIIAAIDRVIFFSINSDYRLVEHRSSFFHKRFDYSGLYDYFDQMNFLNQTDSCDQCQYICVAQSLNSTYCILPDNMAITSNKTLVCLSGNLINSNVCVGLNATCADYQFECESKQCIAYYNKCDSVAHCLDKSDEAMCSYNTNITCQENGFLCDNESLCINNSSKCDGFFDCTDQSDERNCTQPCVNGDIMCGDRTCINKNLICNGLEDCNDGTDEMNCTNECTIHEYKCIQDKCIDKKQLCDFTVDCKLGDDETSCNFHRVKPCKDILCEHGSCFEAPQLCESNVLFGLNCSIEDKSKLCAQTRINLSCKNNVSCFDHCITDNQICNGYSECINSLDEKNCSVNNSTLCLNRNILSDVVFLPYLIDNYCSHIKNCAYSNNIYNCDQSFLQILTVDALHDRYMIKYIKKYELQLSYVLIEIDSGKLRENGTLKDHSNSMLLFKNLHSCNVYLTIIYDDVFLVPVSAVYSKTLPFSRIDPPSSLSFDQYSSYLSWNTIQSSCVTLYHTVSCIFDNQIIDLITTNNFIQFDLKANYSWTNAACSVMTCAEIMFSSISCSEKSLLHIQKNKILTIIYISAGILFLLTCICILKRTRINNMIKILKRKYHGDYNGILNYQDLISKYDEDDLLLSNIHS